jgi:hypothetical protein
MHKNIPNKIFSQPISNLLIFKSVATPTSAVTDNEAIGIRPIHKSTDTAVVSASSTRAPSSRIAGTDSKLFHNAAYKFANPFTDTNTLISGPECEKQTTAATLTATSLKEISDTLTTGRRSRKRKNRKKFPEYKV